jgi:oxygen-dependent protoporphyrinogen oxidase
VTSKWIGRAPEGTVLLRAFVGGANDPGAVALRDEELIEIAVRDLTSVLGIAAPPMLSRVHRWIDAGAQHNVGHLARMDQLAAALADAPGLFVTGSGFHSIGVPDCIADGRSAGSAAADYVKMRA